MRDTCGIHVSAAVRGYMEDTCGIHEEYMRNTCISNVSGEVRISDARYMRDTCGIHVSSEVIKIHAGYMRDT
jgi:hypothetical protein